MQISKSVTFPDAIAQTKSFLNQLEGNELTEVKIEETVTAFVKSENGARGFFVSYLTDEGSFADHPTEGIIQGLKSESELVAELLVKNLAMSSAMIITHQRNKDEEMAQSSKRVRDRVTNLIQQLQLAETKLKSQQLQHSAKTGEGEYKDFLNRWGYDSEQRQVILNSFLAFSR